MANTVTRTVVQKGSHVSVIYLTIQSDGAEETDLVVYDSSTDSAAGSDPLDSKIRKAWYSLSAASTARAFLEWDATTDVLALDLPAANQGELDFTPIGGLPNTSGAGKTGDILLTTTGLEAGDSLTLVLEVEGS